MFRSPTREGEDRKSTEKIGRNIITTEGEGDKKPAIRSKDTAMKNFTYTAKGIRSKQHTVGGTSSLQIRKSDLETKKDNSNTEDNDPLDKVQEGDEATPRIDIGQIKGPAALDSLLFEMSLHVDENSPASDSNKNGNKRGKKVNKAETVRKVSKPNRFDKFAAESETDTHYLKSRRCFGLMDEAKEMSEEKKKVSTSIESLKIQSGEASPPPVITISNLYGHKNNDNTPSKSIDSSPQRRIRGVNSVAGEESKNMSLAKNMTGNFLNLKLDEEELSSADLGPRIDKQREEKLHRGRGRRYKSKVVTHQIDPNSQEAKKYQERIPNEEELKLRRALLAYEKNKDQRIITRNDNGNTTNDKSRIIDNEEGRVNEKVTKAEEINMDKNKDTESSITNSSMGSTRGSYYTLRAAIDEKYVPRSIRNIGYLIVLVFLLLFVMAIVFFVMKYLLYNNLETNIQNVKYSETRIDKLINLASTISIMMAFTADYWQHKEDPSREPTDSFIYLDEEMVEYLFNYSGAVLKNQSIALKNAQTDLSLKSSRFSKDTLKKINPSGIKLYYMDKPGNPVIYEYTIWQAIMEIVVSGYRIASMDISQVNDTHDPTVYFVMANALNNVLIYLEGSENVILDEIEKSRKRYIVIFVILLCVASGAILISTALLIPILRKIKTNKQEVLELFMYIKRKHAQLELTKCRRFLGSIQSNQETEFNVGEPEEPQQEEEEEQEAQEKAKKFEMSEGYGLAKRRSKKLVINFGLLIFKFFFVILVMEGYFILDYFLSSTFLNRVSLLTKELSLLLLRLSTDSLAITSIRYLKW